MTGAVMDSLRGISRVQSSIASIPSALSRLDAEIKNATHTFKDLSIVHEMPLAYVILRSLLCVISFSYILLLKLYFNRD